jgi:hypothetical protein
MHARLLSVIFQEHVVTNTRHAQFCFPGFAPSIAQRYSY